MRQIPAPAPGTFAPYHVPYLDLAPPQQWGALMAAQPDQLAALASEARGDFRYAPDKWSLKEVVGHIIDTERIHSCRLLCIARGEQASLPGFDQDAYVFQGGFHARSVGDLLEEFRAVRRGTLALVVGLPAEAFARVGTANGKTIGVAALACLIPGHAAHHLQVIRERY